MSKTIEQINQRIKSGEAVVVTAEEIIDIVNNIGTQEAAKKVDVVTTGTFGPMCSSSAYINIGHSKPKIKCGAGEVTLNEVPVYTGFAAADLLIGATALPKDDPRNNVYPGKFQYGGAHVIEDLVNGKDIVLQVNAHGTDCYPRKKLSTYINIKDINEAVLLNPRNAYQNYNVAINMYKEKTIYTYLGMLKPKIGNANYCCAGQLSPLMNDPLYKTIGIGTKIFLGGAEGYVFWQGTQHNPSVKRSSNSIPLSGAGTLGVTGDLKQMSPDFLRGVSMQGYGVSLSVGIGVPIPILNEEIVKFTAIKDEDITAPIIDYSNDYPNNIQKNYGHVSYKELRSGSIKINGKDVPTASLSSYYKAREIAEELKKRIKDKKFFLSVPVAAIPGKDSGVTCKGLKERPVKD